MSAPLVPIVLAWIAGLLVGARLPLAVWLVGAGAVLGSGIVWTRGRPVAGSSARISPVFVTLVVLAALLGGARGATHQFTFGAGDVATYNDTGTVTLHAIVARYPEARGSTTRYEVAARAVETEGFQGSVQGRVLVTLPPYPAFQYGDELQITGELVTPPVLEGFDYRAFLAHQGVFSLIQRGHAEQVAVGRGSPLYHALFALRQRAERTVQLLLPEPHASLMSGILLGIESGIPDDVKEAFNATGTTHVLVISGSNFAVLTAIFLMAGRRLLGKQRGSLLALVAIALYALLVGGDPPVVRAAIMGGLSIVALLLRREGVALNTLAGAVLAMLAADPGQLHNVGFQLSALATLGLILLSVPLTTLAARLLARGGLSPVQQARFLPLLSDALLVTLAAQLITTPLIVGTFGRFSLVSLLANVLILPAQGLLLAGGGLATLAGMLWLPLGRFLAALPYGCLAWTVSVVRTLAALPLASVALRPLPTAFIWLFYALAGLWWYLKGVSPQPVVISAHILPAENRESKIEGRKWLPWAVLALATFLPWWLLRQLPDGKLHLYALDVGQGDALLIVAPDGKQVLVDGGPDPVPLLSELGDRLPPWDRTLELIVLSHADADHLAGLPELLGRYRATQVLDSGFDHDTALYGEWEARLRAHRVVPAHAVPGQRWALGGGAVLEVLAPAGEPFDTLNDNAVVLRLRYGTFCALLTGDIEAEAEARLVQSGALSPCTVLKVAHHGSHTSSTEGFLDAVQPRYALVSAGRANRFGHPHADVVERFAARGVRLFRTDTQGTLHLWTDGRGLWVETER